MKWVPLHVHSQYSILDAAAPIDEIASQAAAFGMPAVALTDHGNLFGAVEFYKACKDVKIKPIMGCEFYVAPNSRFEKKKEPGNRYSYHITLLAKNSQGYQNLCRLSSLGYLEGFYYNPRIDNELLKKYSQGLICLSGCLSGRLAQEILHGSATKALEIIQWNRELFGEDYYLELMRHPMSQADMENDGMHQESWLVPQHQEYIKKQNKVNDFLIETARNQKIPLVATNDSHYMRPGRLAGP